MAREGVGGLSLSEVARRMGIQPPSLYKYFPSKLAVYDALFERASREMVATFRSATRDTRDGLAALVAGLEAVTRQALQNQVMAQLINWRPVPGFEPSERAFAPNVEFVEAVREQVAAAVRRAELDPDAQSESGMALLSVLISGVISQQLANEPAASFEEGRFTSLFPTVLSLFVEAYRPEKGERDEADA